MPAMSNITLFFINAERESRIAITTTAPRKAETTSAQKPDKTKSPENKLPPPISITIATPKLEPELMPKIEESANGL